MKRITLIIGMIIALVFSMIILTACSSTDTTSKDNSDTAEETKEEVINDYTYKELSFKLPSNYIESESGGEESKIYSTNFEDDVMKLFSVASLSAQGTDFIANASESLGEYDFALTGYDVTSKGDPQVGEINGMKTISVDMKYNNSTTNGNAEVEYCYAQKGDTVYVMCFELFTQNGKKIEESDLSTTFDTIKSSLKFAE